MSARILNEFASMGLTKYREFCVKYNVSEKVEIDMESTHYVALRSKLVKENLEIKEKYKSLEVLVQKPNDTYKEKIEEDDALNSYYRMVVNKVQE